MGIFQNIVSHIPFYICNMVKWEFDNPVKALLICILIIILIFLLNIKKYSFDPDLCISALKDLYRDKDNPYGKSLIIVIATFILVGSIKFINHLGNTH